jgi:hypothetical protein
MSIYNTLFGVDPLAEHWLEMLGLRRKSVGRFRDCYLRRDEGGQLRICVYTRNGGGNREIYKDVLDALSKHPCWIGDKDDGFDPTYCTIEFKIPPERASEVYGVASTGFGVPSATPEDRWRELIAKLEKGDVSGPEAQKALAFGKQLLEEIQSGKKRIIET